MGAIFLRWCSFLSWANLLPNNREEDSDDEENFVEDKDRFCGQDSRFEGREAPIFFKCICAFQENMPNTMEEIHEIFEQSKKRKKDLEQLDRDLVACQEELDQSQEDLNEALDRQTVLDDKSEAQRVHEMALLDKKMKLQELKLSTAQLEAEISKT